MEERILQELSEVIQSSNINFLVGAGVSNPFLPPLGNIEQKLNEAKDDSERETQLKEYFSKVMLPNKGVIENSISSDKYKQTTQSYDDFFLSLSDVILRRKSTILSKQVNLFTTNIDVLMETTLERLLIEYNDGFSGKFNPTFSPANYKKSIYQRSLHYDHISEIPVFNIVKMHGSLTWLESGDKITFSHSLSHIDPELSKKTGEEFFNPYKKILVVNPEESKHLESVLNLYYYELLRMYSSELEKENATLFVLGFSMDDKHIKEITLRAAKANPTLRVFVCCSKKEKQQMFDKLEVLQHPNVSILSMSSETEYQIHDGSIPEEHETDTSSDNIYFTLPFFTKEILNKVINKQSDESSKADE